MILKLQRLYLKPYYTIGKLYIEDKYFCDTLEDKYRDLHKVEKIPGLTAIPYGIYRVKMTMSNRFQRIMPELFNVPYFDSIRIHSGNFDGDTDGCILIGKNDIVGGLVDSRMYSDQLNLMLMNYDDDIVIIVE